MTDQSGSSDDVSAEVGKKSSTSDGIKNSSEVAISRELDEIKNSQDSSSSPDCEANDEVCQNPEPPKELAELIDADNIGDTVFSKHWLFTVLMRLLQVIEQQAEHDAQSGTDSTASTCFDLDDDLQDNLCKLWDMSMNQEVVKFLVEFKAIELLSGIIAKSRAPRATEICVGILGNMACTSSVCQEICSNRKLLELLALLLDSPDSPTLVELTRLLRVCIASDNESAASAISILRDLPHVYPSVLFILQSSTNGDLLKNAAEFVDKLMDVDEGICLQWSTQDFVLAVMEAVKQTGLKDCKDLETFIHVLQLVSTSETGVQALVSYAGEVFRLIMRYLVHICLDEIVAMDDYLSIITSSFAVLAAVFGSWDTSEYCLVSDFQLLRCILKILEFVYVKIKNTHTIQLSPRKRSLSRAISEERDRDNSSRNSRQNSTNSEENDAAGKVETSEREDSTVEAKSDELTCDQSNKESKNADQCNSSAVHEKIDDEFRNKMILYLYEVIQNLLIDVITILERLPVADSEEQNGENLMQTTVEEEVDRSSSNKTPVSLTYLDSQCDRHRLQCFLLSLNDISHKKLVSALYSVGQKHGLRRLCRIINDTVPLHTIVE